MSSKRTVAIATFVLVIFVVIVYVAMSISYKNKDVQLRNAAKNKQESLRSEMDKLWKTISQSAQITEQYKEDFYKIYTGVADKRYGGKDPSFTWIQESNPNLDPALYLTLANKIDAGRAEFNTRQKELLDIKREHDNLREMPVPHFFLGDIESITVYIITSDKTEDIINQGKDNDVKLFKD